MSTSAVQQALSARRLVEHGLPHLVVTAIAAEALFGAVVDAGGAEGAQQVADRADHLVVGGAVGEASLGCQKPS